MGMRSERATRSNCMSNPISAGKVAHQSTRGFGPAWIDVDSLRAYRYTRVQEQLREHDCAAILLNDPVNIRYATDTRNMAVWLLHNPGRYCLVPAVGRAVLFEYPHKSCLAIAPQIPEIAEVRLATAYGFQYVGEYA